MYNPFVSFFSPETLMLSHYLKFPEVSSECPRTFCACLRSSAQRKADVNDASSSNLFPINTVLTSRRLGFSQKKEQEKKKPGECRRYGEDGGEACGTIVHRAHSADLWINIFRRHPAENYSRKYLDFRFISSRERLCALSVRFTSVSLFALARLDNRAWEISVSREKAVQVLRHIYLNKIHTCFHNF